MKHNIIHNIDVERSCIHSAKNLLDVLIRTVIKENLESLKRIQKALQDCDDVWLLIRNTVEINEKKQKEILEEFQSLQLIEIP